MNETQIEITIPHLFRCPISLDLLEDPVTLCTGQTYDRSSIEKWLSAGNLTCPVTMQRLHDPSFVPNTTLRHLIRQWLLQFSPQFDNSDAAAANDYLASLKHTLESQESSSLPNKLIALEKIRALSDEYCNFKKSCFVQLNFLSLLLELVFGRKEDVQMDQFAELALSCILKLLPIVNLEPLNMIKDESKFEKFLTLFEKGTISVKTSLCHLIDSVASTSETEELCQLLGNNQKLLNQIVLLFRQNFEASPMAAIRALCCLQSNRESVVKSGAIDCVIEYISGSEKGNKILGMGIIEKLMVVESGKVAILNHPFGIETLVKMVFRVCNQDCSESAVGVLLILCRDFASAREEAIGAGVLTQLLFLLQSQCGNRAKSKAMMLLKLLRSKWDDTDEPKKKITAELFKCQ